MFDTRSDRMKLDIIRSLIRKEAAKARKLKPGIPPDEDIIDAFDKLVDLVDKNDKLGLPAWGVAVGALSYFLKDKHDKNTKHRGHS